MNRTPKTWLPGVVGIIVGHLGIFPAMRLLHGPNLDTVSIVVALFVCGFIPGYAAWAATAWLQRRKLQQREPA